MRADRDRCRCGLVGLAALLVLAGCAGSPPAPGRESRIPAHARPQELAGHVVTPGEELVGYRRLTRDDFRAAAPPAQLGANVAAMGAVTCATIRARPGAQYEFRTWADRIDVRMLNLRFEAVMDPDCSWWNAQQAVVPEAYVLEHEQVHLGIFELEARRLTRRANEVTALSAPPGTTQDEVARRVQSRIDAELDASTRAVLERSLRFDEETSFGHEPDRQRRWLERVERELAELGR